MHVHRMKRVTPKVTCDLEIFAAYVIANYRPDPNGNRAITGGIFHDTRAASEVNARIRVTCTFVRGDASRPQTAVEREQFSESRTARGTRKRNKRKATRSR